MNKNKRKTGMHRLRSKIIIFFLVITFIASLFDALLESIVDYIAPKVIDDDKSIIVLVTVTILINISIYVISGYVFYRLTRKEIQKESERQISERNLVYAAIAHDLKTPMTSVQGFSKALMDGKIKPEEQHEIAEIIYQKANVMNDMVEMLFDYSKLGTNEFKPVKSMTDICSLVRDTVAENYTDFETHNIEIDIDIPNEPLMKNIDKKDVKRAVTNIIVNVYKHNPDGIKAKISVEKENDNAVIKVSDSGNIIPDDMDIFEPFVTENTSRTHGKGTGLGLAITKRIIERNDGKIAVVNENGEYTKTFKVAF